MSRRRPPRLAEALLGLLLPRSSASEATLGDLAEEFEARRRRQAPWRAAAWYWKQAAVVGGAAAVAGRATKPGGMLMDGMAADVRYAIRALLRNRGFSALVVLTLGLGIGVNSAVYSLIHGVLVQSLPYEGGDDRLVQLRQPAAAENDPDIGFSVQELIEYRQRNTALDELAEYHTLYFNLLGLGTPKRVFVGVVSANFFETLGVRPMHGRVFVEGDDRPGSDPVLVLTYDFWMSEFGGDPRAIGRTVEMNDLVHTVVGVLPPVPLYPDRAEVYLPTAVCPLRSGDPWIEGRSVRRMSLFGQLAEGSDIERLRTELAAIGGTMHTDHPESYVANRGISTTAVALREALVEEARPAFLVLFATAGLVLLIAITNVANLTFSRLVRRERELTVRAALGSGRRRLVRLVLTESVIAGVMGGLAGLVLAQAGVGLMTDLAAGYTPRAREVEISLPVLVFTAVTAVAAGIASGLVPLVLGRAGRARTVLVTGSATADRRRRGMQRGMVVAQVATAFVLLIAAGLTIRSLGELYAVDPGYGTKDVLTMEIPARVDRSAAESNRFYQDLLSRVRALPSVEAASVAMTFPLDGWGRMATGVLVEGRESRPDDLPPRADIRTVTSGYFETMGIEIVRGRTLTQEDEIDSAPVAVVNQELVRRLFFGVDPLGRRVSWDGGSTWLTIVGVSSNVKHYGMDADIEMEIYQPTMMMMNSLLIRTASEASSLTQPVAEVVAALDPEQPVANVATMGQRRSESLSTDRLIATLLGLFAALAGVITAAGIAGVTASTVSQRLREIGIRMAMGASRRSVVGLLVREGMAFTVVGLALGGVVTLALGRYVGSLLYGVAATDPLTLTAVSGAFLIVALGAVLLPARRAAAVHPREVLTID